MSTSSKSKSAQIRERLNHPIIDIDGHMLELGPLFLDYFKQLGGGDMVKRFLATDAVVSELLEGRGHWHTMTDADRRDAWMPRPTWWNWPTGNTLDRASCHLPRLLRERLDELGIDFTILYPSLGFRVEGLPDAEMRRIGCRAFNTYLADYYREQSDRMTPAAMIPTYNPQEAIEELEYAVKVLGLKVVMLDLVRRPIPKVSREHPGAAGFASRIDNLAFESAYNYDPLWAKFVELGVVAASHASLTSADSQRSISSYMYAHLGSFALAGEVFCKSLFMGGVTRRFPTLKFAFLEGGVGWACTLYADLIGHWYKRNPNSLLKNLDPAKLDVPGLMSYVTRYGDSKVIAKAGELRAQFSREFPRPEVLDEWAACRIEKAEDIRDLFIPNFYFGCEADDPINVWAFNTRVNPFGAKLKAIFDPTSATGMFHRCAKWWKNRGKWWRRNSSLRKIFEISCSPIRSRSMRV